MTVQLDSHGEDCWKVPSHYWCASKKIEQLKAEIADLESVKSKTDAMLQLVLGDREALRSKLRAEAERVTERDCNVLNSLGDRVYSTEVCEAIRAWQARERKR